MGACEEVPLQIRPPFKIYSSGIAGVIAHIVTLHEVQSLGLRSDSLVKST